MVGKADRTGGKERVGRVAELDGLTASLRLSRGSNEGLTVSRELPFVRFARGAGKLPSVAIYLPYVAAITCGEGVAKDACNTGQGRGVRHILVDLWLLVRW